MSLGRHIGALSLAFILGGGGATAADFGASAWTDYNRPKPLPDSPYADAGCKGDAACRAAAWKKVLGAFGQDELDAPSGGRAYRVIVGAGPADPNLAIVRLDIAADSRATVTTIFRGQPGQGASFPNRKVEAFDAALAASQFEKAPASAATGTCAGGQPLVFEAMVDDRYKVVSEPCGDPAGLAAAVAVLRGG